MQQWTSQSSREWSRLSGYGSRSTAPRGEGQSERERRVGHVDDIQIEIGRVVELRRLTVGKADEPRRRRPHAVQEAVSRCRADVVSEVRLARVVAVAGVERAAIDRIGRDAVAAGRHQR